MTGSSLTLELVAGLRRTTFLALTGMLRVPGPYMTKQRREAVK